MKKLLTLLTISTLVFSGAVLARHDNNNRVGYNGNYQQPIMQNGNQSNMPQGGFYDPAQGNQVVQQNNTLAQNSRMNNNRMNHNNGMNSNHHKYANNGKHCGFNSKQPQHKNW